MLTIYTELRDLYIDSINKYNINSADLDLSLESKKYEHVPTYKANKETHLEYKNKLKFILKKYFEGDINGDIVAYENEYKKIRKMNEAIWKDYGSELAGGFGSDEKELERKIKILKGILK
jgi:hypothetical protein